MENVIRISVAFRFISNRGRCTRFFWVKDQSSIIFYNILTISDYTDVTSAKISPLWIVAIHVYDVWMYCFWNIRKKKKQKNKTTKKKLRHVQA